MTDLQQKLLDMISWFHNFCVENNLTYYALGGTALGAVRHNGFIPWDDDLDVGMPRSDYEKLKKLSEKISSTSRFTVEFPSSKKDYVYTYGKLYDTETTLIENTRYKTKRGIYIDIFPLDGMGNTEDEALKHFKKTEKLNNILHTRVCGIRNGRKWYKNLAIILSRCIPNFILDARKITQKMDSIAASQQFEACEYVANCSGAWREKEIHRRNDYGTPALCKFENVQIYIPENSDAYLKGLYGNYMTLPPVEKRITHHDYIYMNLEESYLN